ncbi:hypothetical protein FQN60_014412, partial [Etheostoma spectabile]
MRPRERQSHAAYKGRVRVRTGAAESGSTGDGVLPRHKLIAIKRETTVCEMQRAHYFSDGNMVKMFSQRVEDKTPQSLYCHSVPLPRLSGSHNFLPRFCTLSPVTQLSRQLVTTLIAIGHCHSEWRHLLIHTHSSCPLSTSHILSSISDSGASVGAKSISVCPLRVVRHDGVMCATGMFVSMERTEGKAAVSCVYEKGRGETGWREKPRLASTATLLTGGRAVMCNQQFPAGITVQFCSELQNQGVGGRRPLNVGAGSQCSSVPPDVWHPGTDVALENSQGEYPCQKPSNLPNPRDGILWVSRLSVWDSACNTLKERQLE